MYTVTSFYFSNLEKIFEIFGTTFGLIFLTLLRTTCGTIISWIQENMWDNIWRNQVDNQTIYEMIFFDAWKFYQESGVTRIILLLHSF